MKTNRKKQAMLVTSIATLSLGLVVSLTQQVIANSSFEGLQNTRQNFDQDQLLGASESRDNSQPSQEVPPAIQKALHQQLQQRYRDVNFQIQNTTKTRKEWSNACLELAAPDEMCAQVMTPGYEFQIRGKFKGKQLMQGLWVFHTNEELNQIRFNEQASQLPDPADMNKDQPEVPCAIKQKLNQQLQQRYPDSHFKITEIQQQSQQWPNGCLGLAKPDEMCTQAIVPGQKVTIRGKFDAAEPIKAVWVFHTNQDFNHIRLNQKASQLPHPEKVPKG